MDSLSFRIFEGGRTTPRLSNERDLIIAAQRGDTPAFKELYEHYRDRIYNLIYYSLKDVNQAEDALQSVFVKVLQALPFFRLESCFLTWIYRVALNECKNRQRGRRLFVSFTQINLHLLDENPASAPDILQASEQLAKLVRSAVMDLKPKYRTVVILRYLEDLSYQEIASVLGFSTGTVASRLYRALEILERRLSRFGHKNRKEVSR